MFFNYNNLVAEITDTAIFAIVLNDSLQTSFWIIYE